MAGLRLGAERRSASTRAASAIGAARRRSPRVERRRRRRRPPRPCGCRARPDAPRASMPRAMPETTTRPACAEPGRQLAAMRRPLAEALRAPTTATAAVGQQLRIAEHGEHRRRVLEQRQQRRIGRLAQQQIRLRAEPLDRAAVPARASPGGRRGERWHGPRARQARQRLERGCGRAEAAQQREERRPGRRPRCGEAQPVQRVGWDRVVAAHAF